MALLAVAALSASALAMPEPAQAAVAGRPSYGWPLKPCDRQHAVRAHLGAPRTIFDEPLHDGGLDGPARVSFHNGIDIVAPSGKAVYPVVSGTVRRISGGLAVVTDDGREFRYQHISRRATPGKRVEACRSVLGFVRERKDHLHFVEVDRGKVVNPLSSGRLRPHSDRTKPRIDTVTVGGRRADSGWSTDVDRQSAAHSFREGEGLLELSGHVRVGAQAYDVPAIRVHWPEEWARMRRLPLAPAALELTLRPAKQKRIVARLASFADFVDTVPANELFWRVYERGTHQNWPVIGGRWHKQMPGTYRLRFPWLDTRDLPNGRYALKVTAFDARGNRGWLRIWVRIANRKRANGNE